MEVLAVTIRANPVISGLHLPGSLHRLPVLSLYADDTSVISTSDAATLATFETYARFEKGTGAKLNMEKCEGLWLGTWRNRLDAPVPIQWTLAKLKPWGYLLRMGVWMRLIGSHNWKRSKSVLYLGVGGLFHMAGRRW